MKRGENGAFAKKYEPLYQEMMDFLGKKEHKEGACTEAVTGKEKRRNLISLEWEKKVRNHHEPKKEKTEMTPLEVIQVLRGKDHQVMNCPVETTSIDRTLEKVKLPAVNLKTGQTSHKKNICRGLKAK